MASAEDLLKKGSKRLSKLETTPKPRKKIQRESKMRPWLDDTVPTIEKPIVEQGKATATSEETGEILRPASKKQRKTPQKTNPVDARKVREDQDSSLNRDAHWSDKLGSGYTTFPNEILMKFIVPGVLSAKEISIFFTIWRLTFGFQREWEKISMRSFQLYTGMNNDTRIRNALKSLEAHGLIESRVDIQTKSYRVIFDREKAKFSSAGGTTHGPSNPKTKESDVKCSKLIKDYFDSFKSSSERDLEQKKYRSVVNDIGESSAELAFLHLKRVGRPGDGQALSKIFSFLDKNFSMVEEAMAKQTSSPVVDRNKEAELKASERAFLESERKRKAELRDQFSAAISAFNSKYEGRLRERKLEELSEKHPHLSSIVNDDLREQGLIRVWYENNKER